MKTRFPLLLKMSVWLGLNLVLLLGLGLGFVVSQGGLGGFLSKPIGDRLQAVADAASAEMAGVWGGEREGVLARFEANYGLRFFVFENSGEQVVGEQVILPWRVEEQLRPDGRQQGSGALRPRPDGLNPPPRRKDDALLRRNQPPPQAGPDGRIFERAGEPVSWWVGVRVPVSVGPGTPPRPGVFFAVSESILAFGGLLDLRPVIWAVAAAMVVSVLFWAPFILRMTQSLGRMVAATERIAEGRFDTRVTETRGDEIGRLGDSINRMAARLDGLVNGQKKFLADVAHELGSPIGRLQVGTSILEERVSPVLQPAVADVREEVQHMSALVGELLAFTKAGMRAPESGRVEVDLEVLVQRAAEREGMSVDLEIVIDPMLRVWADEGLLIRAVGNVLRNAVRYGEGRATVRVSATQKPGNRVEMTIADDGPGVPPEALSRLGEPFYRPDGARAQETGGVGLGLSIVKSAIGAMGGRVRFANREPRGFEVTIELLAADGLG